MSIYKIIIFCAFLCLNCNSEIEDNMNGHWVIDNYDKSQFEEVIIDGDSITLVDKYGYHRFGLIDRGEIVNSNLSLRISTNSKELGEDQLMIDSIIYNRINYWFTKNTDKQKFKIIGLKSNVQFITSIQDQNYLPIKLRNQVFEKRLTLGDRNSNLNELILFAPNTICSSSRPKQIHYDGAIIFIEEGSDLRDLLNVQQQLLTRNRITKFILVTEATEYDRYQVVVNHVLNLPSDLTDMNKEIESYLGVSYPQLPPPLNHGNSLDYLNSDRVLFVKINSLSDLKEMETQLLDSSKNIIVQINSNLSIEAYIEILIKIQNMGIEIKSETMTRIIS